MFWADLSKMGFIEDTFSTASSNTGAVVSGASIDAYFPQAKLGRSNYIYVWSGGPLARGTGTFNGDGENYFAISPLSSLNVSYTGNTSSSPGLSVSEAFQIDQKVDDGLPQSGRVLALYVNNSLSNPYWAYWAGAASANNGPTTAATSGSSTTCYVNGNTAGATQRYSVGQNKGMGVNCALSFQFQ